MKVTKVELLERAQGLMQDAIVLITEATKGDSDAKEYLINPLTIHTSSNHGFLSNDLNIDTLIQRYSGREAIQISIEAEDILEGHSL